MFGQLYESCEMIDDFVELAFTEAIYENSRFALQELACREPVNLARRGYGCDGIDNTCDPNKVIDECNEDIIPVSSLRYLLLKLLIRLHPTVESLVAYNRLITGPAAL